MKSVKVMKGLFERDNRRRFAAFLMTRIVLIVTGAVILISGVLYVYFGERLDLKFEKKVMAQKGHMEIILETRLTKIQNMLKNLASDNTIRFTMKMNRMARLEERLKEFYLYEESVYFFAARKGQELLTPVTYPGIPEDIILRAQSRFSKGEIIGDGPKTRLIWWLEAPVRQPEENVGSLYALYDMTKDLDLLETISQTIDGDIAISKADFLLSMINGKSSPLTAEVLKHVQKGSEIVNLRPETILVKLNGFKNIYFSTSQRNHVIEKRRIALLLGFSSLLVLGVSITLSLFLGRQMALPLKEMAAKAIQISEGKKEISFETTGQNYLEFNQLSEAFNYMIGHLKAAEEKARYNELLENIDDPVYLVDREGRIQEANEATYAELDYSREGLFKTDFFHLLPKKDSDLLLGQLDNRAENNDSAKRTLESLHFKSDGTTIPVEIKSRAITYGGKEVILNVARDISERVEAEKALRESEARYRSVVENSHDAIVILDDQLRILYANSELRNKLGFSNDELEGEEFEKILAEDSLPFDREKFLRTENADNILSHTCSMICKDGEKRLGKITATLIEDSAGEVKTVVQILDITEQRRSEEDKKKLEAQLRHAQKMEAVGTLAGGVAHDFNNLLQAIQGYADLLILDKTEDSSERRGLLEIKHATKSASELTQQLLTFSRKVESDLRPTDLNHEVMQIHKLLARVIPAMIETEVHLADDLATINADPAQLGQILMNLCVNARDAMQDGGKLLIETDNASLDENYCRTHLGAVPGRYVLLSISDNGEGMEKSTLEHIFEPFYTTKDMGKGTGLGLAIVYGIVKSHNGYIMCYSEPGKGTVFKIYLPVIEQEAALVDRLPEIVQIGGSETILIADDDVRIRNLGLEVLSKVGYNVVVAEDGEGTLDLYRNGMDDIDLIILDLMMPGMGGEKCLKRLLNLDPTVNVIIASGYSPKGPARDAIDGGAKGFLGKPYEIPQMLQLVREILDNGHQK
ncbi:MAG: PAS domain S-box protein [Thermodesulfobacteriota bacterium]|nr:PAS domain S-box protein [Thermodesulfobacteriota bacterium]